jgi:hypothetical protein
VQSAFYVTEAPKCQEFWRIVEWPNEGR